jgi:hypothetical protein
MRGCPNRKLSRGAHVPVRHLHLRSQVFLHNGSFESFEGLSVGRGQRAWDFPASALRLLHAGYGCCLLQQAMPGMQFAQGLALAIAGVLGHVQSHVFRRFKTLETTS